MAIRVCGFFTNDKYKALAERMSASAERLGYKTSVYEMPHFHDEAVAWGFALRHKPVVVERAMLEHPEDDMLYMDADCEMVSDPVLLKENSHTFDIAVNFIRPHHIHGCVMFFRGKRGLEYVRKWKESYELYPHIRLDEIHAYFALKECQKIPGFRMLTLPFSYTWVPWTAGKLYPTAKPIIIHHGEGRGPDKDTVLREASFHLPV